MKKHFLKRPLVRLFIGVFILGVLLGILTINSLENTPRVKPSAELSQNDLKRVEQLIRKNDPHKIKAGQLVSSQISQSDLNLLLNYIIQKMAVRSPEISKRQINSFVSLQKEQADIHLSISLPEISRQKYINISASFAAKNENDYFELNLKSLTIGKINVPGFISDLLIKKIHNKLMNEVTEYSLIRNSIKNINFYKHKLKINYVFDKQFISQMKEKLKARMIPENLRQALIAQTTQLAYSSQSLELQPSIDVLLKPMFELAMERSKVSDPIVENKAVFIVLAAFSVNKNISQFFDKDKLYKIKSHKVYLASRHDLSRHFLVSAAITSVADLELAKLIGLEKEMGDSQGGSGFSFVDLAADYAGARLANYSVENENQARAIQHKFATLQDESEYMPSIEKLAEGIYRTDLNSGFRSSEQYVEMENLILKRIQQLSIYQ